MPPLAQISYNFIRKNLTIMLRHLSAILLFVILPHAKISAQEREHISHTRGPKNTRSGEEYEVLKDDTAIKDGQYQFLSSGKVTLSGFYNHGQKDSVWEAYYGTSGFVNSRKWYAKGQRTGQWDFYRSKGALEWSFNFTTGTASVQRLIPPFTDLT